MSYVYFRSVLLSPSPCSLKVLMPSAVHTLEVPVMPLGVLADVIVHVSVVFPDTEVGERFLFFSSYKI